MAKVTISFKDGTRTEWTTEDREEIRAAEERAFTDSDVVYTHVTDIAPNDQQS